MVPAKPNVLLLSAGRRVELAQAFRAELRERVPEGRVYATDHRPTFSAACQVVDRAFASPKVSCPTYVEFLLDLCLSNNIGIVIPTIDWELEILSSCRDEFLNYGINVIISDIGLVSSCRDKRRTADLFSAIGLQTPKIFERGDLSFPCFVKPFDGSRSLGARMLPDRNALSEEMLNDPKLMFMEYVDRAYTEYTVDAYYDRGGRLCCVVPRERIEVRDGEVSKGITRRGELYNSLIDALGKISGARGCLTVQLFARNEDHKYIALEINPRFGGGFPLAYAAGANFPGWLIDEYILGLPVEFSDSWRADLLMLRYDAKILIDAG